MWSWRSWSFIISLCWCAGFARTIDEDTFQLLANDSVVDSTTVIMGTSPNLTSTPGGITETPGGITETPGSITETPGGITETPGGITETPGGITETPGGITETPGGITETPGGITETPGGITETPGGITDTPGGITDTPGGITETPDGITETPDGITETPDDITETPDGITDTPDGITETPGGITDTPDGITETPDGITDTPVGNTSDTPVRLSTDSRTEGTNTDSDGTDAPSADTTPTNITTLSSISTAGTTTTTTSTTTTTPPSTTTYIYPLPDAAPGDWSDSYFIWNLSFVLVGPGPYNDTPEHRQEILSTLRACFWDEDNVALGYKDIDEQSIRINSSLISYVRMTARLRYLSTQTGVKYSVLYFAEEVLKYNTTANISNFIEYQAMARLKQANFSGSYETNDTYIDDEVIDNELPTQTSNINDVLQQDFCVSVNPDCPSGYNCVSNNVSYPCVPVCYSKYENPEVVCCDSTSNVEINEQCERNGHETCTPTINPTGNEFTYVCSCDPGYSDIFGTCLDSFWVAFTGLTVAVVTIIICVVLTVIICTQKPRKQRRKLSTEEKFNSAFVDDGSYDNAQSNPYSKQPELKSFQSEKSSPPVDKRQPSPGSYQYNLRNDVGYGSDGPASSSSSDAVSETDIPIELLQSPAYTGFQANLAVVDTSVNYFHNRPSIKIKRF